MIAILNLLKIMWQFISLAFWDMLYLHERNKRIQNKLCFSFIFVSLISLLMINERMKQYKSAEMVFEPNHKQKHPSTNSTQFAIVSEFKINKAISNEIHNQIQSKREHEMSK